MLAVIFILTIAIPACWLVSEFQSRKEIRITLGILSIAMSFGIAWIVGSLERLNSNSWYGAATKDFIQNTIVELEDGNSERVLNELRVLRSQFHPTYETRADYDKLVGIYVQAISDNPIVHQGGDPGWTVDPVIDPKSAEPQTDIRP
jgi:hypothetical protein